jgi:hypothetical protein
VSLTRNHPRGIYRVLEETLSKQLHSSVHQLKIALGIRIAIVGQVKDLLLEIGAIIEELKVCELSQTSTKIKQLLREEILAKKITARYVHKILPQKCKRRYRFQRELGSLYPAYYDIWTATSSRKKILVEGSVLVPNLFTPSMVKVQDKNFSHDIFKGFCMVQDRS